MGTTLNLSKEGPVTLKCCDLKVLRQQLEIYKLVHTYTNMLISLARIGEYGPHLNLISQ